MRNCMFIWIAIEVTQEYIKIPIIVFEGFSNLVATHMTISITVNCSILRYRCLVEINGCLLNTCNDTDHTVFRFVNTCNASVFATDKGIVREFRYVDLDKSSSEPLMIIFSPNACTFLNNTAVNIVDIDFSNIIVDGISYDASDIVHQQQYCKFQNRAYILPLKCTGNNADLRSCFWNDFPKTNPRVIKMIATLSYTHIENLNQFLCAVTRIFPVFISSI